MTENTKKLIDILKNGDYLCLTPRQQEEIVKNVDMDFVENHKDKLDFEYVFKHKKLSIDQLERYFGLIKSRLDLSYVATMQELTEDFMSKHKGDLPWTLMSNSQNMSLDFIKKHQTYVDFSYLPFYQEDIPADFLADKEVNWKKMSSDFPLSEEFIMTYFRYLDKELVKLNKKIRITPKIQLLLKLN